MKQITLIYRGTIRAKKNSKQIIRTAGGHPMIISNSAARANEADMVAQFRAQLRQQGIRPRTDAERVENMAKGVEKYAIDATIYQPDGIRRDLDNQITSILDALTKSGAILDDCRKFVKKISVSDGGIDRTDPRAEITITTYEAQA